MGDEPAPSTEGQQPAPSRDWRFGLAALAGLVLGLAVLTSPGGVVSRASGNAASLAGSDTEGQLAVLGRSSVSWTMADLLAPTAGRLKSGRVLVAPLTCDRGGDRSTWLTMIARRLSAPDLAPLPPEAGPAILAAAAAQGGKPPGSLSALRLAPENPLRRTGISGLVFVCASPRQTVQEDEIAEIARAVVRLGRQEARGQDAQQVAIPRLPFKLDANGDSRDRGAALFWRAALEEASVAMKPGERVDVLFGLYALGDGGRRNRDAFAAAARESLPGGRPELSKTKTGLVLGGACFAAGAAMAWVRRRRFAAGYLLALLALSATGAGALLASFGLIDLAGFGLTPMAAFFGSLALMAGIGLFAEQAAGFDWRKRLGQAR